MRQYSKHRSYSQRKTQQLDYMKRISVSSRSCTGVKNFKSSPFYGPPCR